MSQPTIMERLKCLTSASGSEAIYPDLPRLEPFVRQQNQGWPHGCLTLGRPARH